MDLSICLGDPQRYLDQIDRLHDKNSRRNRLYELEQDGVPLASLCMNRNHVARVLAKMVGRGRYELGPARIKNVTLNGKVRKLFQLRVTDLIVHGVVAEILNERMQSELSSQVYSYQRGVPWWRAASDFARYVREHRRSRPRVSDRGLYVLRRDIREYTDSIPVADSSNLWVRLRAMLGLEGERDGMNERHWELLRKVVRPEAYREPGAYCCNIRGVPTGSPISTSLFNFYLMPLDQALASISGAFYARYSDDLLFAHPDAGVAREAGERLAAVLWDLNLETNREKDRDLYFNGAGRPTSVWMGTRGTSAVGFLGCEVSFKGVVSLKPRKMRALLRDVRIRVRRTLAALPEAEAGRRGEVVCSVVNEALDPNSPCRQKSAPLLSGLVTDRPQLREIDYCIARIVASGLSGDSSVRAFRKVPYRTLRREWNLVSLYHRRNLKQGDNPRERCRRSTVG